MGEEARCGWVGEATTYVYDAARINCLLRFPEGAYDGQVMKVFRAV